MAKRKNNRAKQRAKIVQNITEMILDNLARIAKGKTPPEIVIAHVDYYCNCRNPVEQSIMFGIFQKEQDKTLTEVAEFFAEK